MGLRSNNIAFMRADDRPYHKDLSEFVKTNRSGFNNSYQEDAQQMRESQQPYQNYNNNQNRNFQAHNNAVDRVLMQRGVNNNTTISPGLSKLGLARSRGGGQNQLPPLRQSSSRGQQHLGGSLKPLHLDEKDLGYHSQQNTKYPSIGDMNGQASILINNKPSFQSNLGKLASTVQSQVNLYNEGQDEIRFHTVNKILDDEVDQDKIKYLENNLEAVKEQVELAKYKYEQKQLNDLENKEREMLNKMDELQNTADEDHEWRGMVRDRLIQMKLQQQELEKREKQYEDYIHKMERETEMEKLVRKKLEIEKMREQQDLLNELHRKKQTELKGIGTELEKKDVDSSGMLKRALLRADVLQKQIDSGSIDTKTQSLLVDAILDKNPENEQIRKQILEEIKAKMSRDKDDQQYKNEELMQQLNMQRMRFMEAEKVIKEKRQMHNEIMRRGMDFLAEIELGNAPPLEYVVKNIYQSRIQNQDPNLDNDIGEPAPVKQTVLYVQQNLRAEEHKLKDLMDEYNRTLNMIQPTDSLSLINGDRYRVQMPEYKKAFVQPIVDEILDSVFRTIDQNQVDVIESKKTINRLKMQKDAREARIDQLAGVISLRELNEQIINGVVEQMAMQVAQESIKLNDQAKMKSMEMVLGIVRSQRDFKMGEPELKRILMGMMEQHLEERKMDIHKIHHTLFVISGENAGKLAEMKISVEQKQEPKKPKNMKDEDFIDDNADVLDPSECQIYNNNPEVKLIEKDYFGLVNIERCQLFGGTLGNKSGGVTALAVSRNKSLVAQAINNGQIQVFNISKNYQLIRKIVTKNTSVYTLLEFGRDNISQLIAVSQAGGILKSFLMKDKNELPIIDPQQTQGKSVAQVLDMRNLIDDQTSDLVPYSEVTYDQFLQPEQKKDKAAQKENVVTTAQIHSQIAPNGFQDYVIVGAKSGTIIRFNTQQQQQNNPNSSQAGQNEQESYNSMNANVDFILGHQVPITFLQSLENPGNPLQCPQVIISMDVAGHIFFWRKPEDKPKFSSKATAKYRLALSYRKFVRTTESRLFPPGKEKEIDAAKSINAKVLNTMTTYMEQNGISCQDIEGKCIDRTVKQPSGVQILMLPVQRPPENNEIREFEEFIFNPQGMLTRRSEVKFKFEEAVSKFGTIKSAKNKRFIVIQIVKDHLFAQKDFQTYEFVIFKSEEQRLAKYKVTLNAERNAIVDYDISDEVQSLGFPYIYVMVNTTIYILSILTNQMIKQYDFAPEVAKLTKKKVKFDRITIGSYQDIFLNSTSFDATMHIRLENLNSPERHTEFVRNYSKLNECWK